MDVETAQGLDFDYESLYKKSVDAVLEYTNCPYECNVSLLLTDDAAITEINRDMRHLDSSTDVLSFPMVEYETPGDFSNLEESVDNFDPDSGELLLGDIVLSVEHVCDQAREFGHAVEREYSFLIVHSMLHLVGFDHIEEADRILMEDAQRSVMELLNIPR